MGTTRTYSDGCAAAHALDLVGERWALLVVRELLFGPKRFTDLRAGMPGASPNVLSQRLRELEEAGVVRHRKLGPPAACWVYELTEWGLGLEPVLTHLGRWGSRSPRLDGAADRSVNSLMLAQRALFDPARSGDLSATYLLRIDEEQFTVRVDSGRLDVTRGEATAPDAVIETDTTTLAAVLGKRQSLGEAVASGRLVLSGDAVAVDRWLAALSRPEAVPVA